VEGSGDDGSHNDASDGDDGSHEDGSGEDRSSVASRDLDRADFMGAGVLGIVFAGVVFAGAFFANFVFVDVVILGTTVAGVDLGSIAGRGDGSGDLKSTISRIEWMKLGLWIFRVRHAAADVATSCLNLGDGDSINVKSTMSCSDFTTGVIGGVELGSETIGSAVSSFTAGLLALGDLGVEVLPLGNFLFGCDRVGCLWDSVGGFFRAGGDATDLRSLEPCIGRPACVAYTSTIVVVSVVPVAVVVFSIVVVFFVNCIGPGAST